MLSLSNNEPQNPDEESDSDKSVLQESDSDAEYPEAPTLMELKHIQWSYVMRRYMQEIIPGLYVGPYSAASRSKLQYLLDHSITHIACVRQDIEAHFIKPCFPDRFKYLVLNVADRCTENIIQYFQPIKAFIDNGIKSGGKVLVHSNAGISRSAALVMSYIMATYGYSYRRALAIVQQKRFCINPNEGFIAQLKEYEPIYKAQRELRKPQLCITWREKTKRPEEDCEIVTADT